MNWFEGDISTAVTVAKEQNSIFMVFVDDETEKSAQLLEFLNIPENKERLNSENFIRVKILSNDETFEQFAKIYKNVPKPSVYFIGQGGMVCILSELNTLEDVTKIVLACYNIAEKARSKTPEPEESAADIERRKKLKLMDEAKEKEDAEKMEKIREQKNVRDVIKRKQNAVRLERERILLQIANDRVEARPYVPPASQTDTSPTTETNKFLDSPTVSKIQFRLPDGQTQVETFENSVKFEKIREHVRNVVVQNINIKDYTLSTSYPRKVFTSEDDSLTLLELNLFPTAVILVIPQAMAGPTAIVARSGGPVNLVNTLVWDFYAFVVNILFRLRNIVSGVFTSNRDVNNDAVTSAAEKRATEKKENSQQKTTGKSTNVSTNDSSTDQQRDDGIPYRRNVPGSNIHRITDHLDSDDENNTWNGNSTQQQ